MMVRPSGKGEGFPLGRISDIRVLMTTQETLIPRKRRGPAPTGQGIPVMVRFVPDQLAQVDAWITAQPDAPTRPEAVRRLIAAALADKAG